MQKKHLDKILIGAAVVIIALVIAFVVLRNPAQATFHYPGGSFDVLVADNVLERTQGLSGQSLDTFKYDGMLFLFPEAAERTFWMKGMKFDLDVVWISGDKIVKIDKRVKAPLPGEEPKHMYSSPHAVDMVLELPAGTVDMVGIVIGHTVRFEP